LPVVSAKLLQEFAARILTAAGLEPEEAAVIASGLVRANLRGVDTHGVLRLLQYCDCLAAGEINPRPRVRVVSRSRVTALVDADGGYGFRPTLLAAELAVELAREHGLGLAGVRASHHFGMAAAYAERIAEAGLIGVVMANTGPVMAPFGGARPTLGNNPIAFAVPRRGPEPPLVLDMALSQVAFGRVRLAAAEGRPIPAGWAYDSRGRPTTDAEEALRAGLLAPMGAHKGSGLSLIVDVLAGVLTGSPVGLEADAHGHRRGGVGHLVLALRPDLFLPEAEFHAALERRLAEVLATPPAEGVGRLLLPGDLELATARSRETEGVPLSAELARQLEALAERLGAGPSPWSVSGGP
jgi:LDH2 family malate/lactate/ureidoglycolate dehydrogenase